MGKHRRGVVAVAAFLTIITSVAAPVLAAGEYGDFLLDPSSGEVGDTIILRGENAAECPETTQIQMGFRSSDGFYQANLDDGAAIENDNGTIAAPFEIPSEMHYFSPHEPDTRPVPPGDHTVYVQCVGEWTYADLTLTVVESSDDPEPPATPPTGDGPLGTSSGSVAPGSDVKVAGNGFEPGEDVSVVLYSSPVVLATATADGSGVMATTVTIPADTAPGGHVLAAFGAEQTLTSPIEVLPAGVTRVAGGDRVATAVEVAQASFPKGAAVVVVASSAAFPDALAGATLAGLLDGPVLLTGQAGLDPLVAAEIERLGATHAVLLGGPVALSPKVADDLEAAVDTLERIDGADRYATGVAIAEKAAELGADTSTVYLTSGENFPDAVAISAAAAATDRPLLLTRPGELPDVTVAALDAMGPDTVVVVGGPLAVSNDVADDASAAAGGATVARLDGPDRYATAVAVAQHGLGEGLTMKPLWLATGQQFPDALSAGPAAAASGSVLLLVGTDTVETATAEFLQASACQIDTMVVVGGPVAVTSAALVDLAEAATC